VGSSGEELTQANAIQRNLVLYGHTVTVWNQGIFLVGKNILENLLDALDTFDAAVFVFAPNDLLTMRGKEFDAVRDNVVFELGLFTGKLGRDRAFWVIPKGQTQLRIASDLLGIVPAEYSEPRDDDWVSALSVACGQINDRLIAAARDRGVTRPPLLPAAVAGFVPRINELMQDLARVVISNALLVADDGIHATSDGTELRARLSSKADLRVTFGRIEDRRTDEPGSVFVLPANEFLDDACITDHKSALGAFVKHHFGGHIDDFKRLVAKRRDSLTPTLVEREEQRYEESYGVGTSLWLDNPLSSQIRMILCAVTRKRAGEGLKAEPAYLFAGMHSVSRVMNDHKMTDVHLPLLGAGHGDMASEVALLCLCLALVRAPHVRHAEIVVFRHSTEADPEITPQNARKILAFAASLAPR
jgi:hypothetical protein